MSSPTGPLLSSPLDAGDRMASIDAPLSFTAAPATLLAYVIISVILLYHLAISARVINLSSVQETFWSMAVYVLPARVLFALDSRSNLETAVNHGKTGIETSLSLHSAKSDALQRLLGLERADLLLGFTPSGWKERVRRMSISKVPRPPGLGNWDNSCYQNSIIQGLASLPSFAKYLDDVQPPPTMAPEQPTSVRTALQTTMRNLNDPSYTNRKLWTPSQLKSMSSWQQQDAQEYFSKILDEVDKEIVKAARQAQQVSGLAELSKDVSKPDELPSIRETMTDERPPETNHVKQTEPANRSHPVPHLLDSDPPSNSCPRNPLEGLLAQRVGCMRCKWSEGLSLIPFICLMLPLGRYESCDVRDCLEESANLELIEGVECAKCTLLMTKAQLDRMLRDLPGSDEASESEDNHDSGSVSALRVSVINRLNSVNTAIEEDDFSDATLTNKCKIPSGRRVTTVKSRQAVIARPPRSLVIHLNRSVFDELTGHQRKNYADVKFQPELSLGPWCLGSAHARQDEKDTAMMEQWPVDPAVSLLGSDEDSPSSSGPHYELRALITHYGRHESGHYVCYRRHPYPETKVPSSVDEKQAEDPPLPRWWRISDDDVTMVSEQNVMAQGGAFMMFYELIEPEDVLDNEEQLDSCASEPSNASNKIMNLAGSQILAASYKTLPIAIWNDEEARDAQSSSSRLSPQDMLLPEDRTSEVSTATSASAESLEAVIEENVNGSDGTKRVSATMRTATVTMEDAGTGPGAGEMDRTSVLPSAVILAN